MSSIDYRNLPPEEEEPKGRFPTAATVVLLVLTALAAVGAFMFGRG